MKRCLVQGKQEAALQAFFRWHDGIETGSESTAWSRNGCCGTHATSLLETRLELNENIWLISARPGEGQSDARPICPTHRCVRHDPTDQRLNQLQLEVVALTGHWGGPTLRYQGAEIECRADGRVVALFLDGHPLDALALDYDLDEIVALIDFWRDRGELP